MKSLFNVQKNDGRQSFWLIQVATAVLYNVAIAICFAIMSDPSMSALGTILLLVSVVVFGWVQVASYVRRLRDAGYHWAWMFFPLVNLVIAGFFSTKEDPK